MQRNEMIASYLQMMNDGYVLSKQNEERVNNVLQQMNLTIEEAKAINLYTENSDIIQAYMRHDDMSGVQPAILDEMRSRLLARKVKPRDIEEIVSFVLRLDYNLPRRVLHQDASALMFFSSSAHATVCMTINRLHTLAHVHAICAQIQSALNKSSTPTDCVVYRATRQLPSGNVVQISGFTSTSTRMDTSFAKYPDYHIVYKLSVPAGTHGLDITVLSDYDTTEQEMLFAPCTITVIDKQERYGQTCLIGKLTT